ncbi:hypothetical protein C8R46DRAFT_1207485 [Mycena filopes]|nr:hypothetical protein C8R46DRAFT_1224291 [Mycena filopes]KAJ7160125.1 hypothetical protein C8R46DRAFT_1223623 [Mycena filopes]KAJ7185309.1 hypothetical protein C8R46DRAFT_1207485 [Mycena filopes]
MLLDSAESGKLTVLKQMKIVHLDGCAAQERDPCKEIFSPEYVGDPEAMPHLHIPIVPQNNRLRESQHNDSAVSYSNSNDRIADQDQDILRPRVKATANGGGVQDIFIELQSSAYV